MKPRNTSRKIRIAAAIIFATAIAMDGCAYRQDRQWWERLNQNIHVGSRYQEVKSFLVDDAVKNAITGFREFHGDGDKAHHSIIFDNHNRSIIWNVAFNGIDQLLQGGVVVWFDDKDLVEKLYSSE